MKDWAQVIGAGITLLAVLVALGIGIASILHTQSMQKKERRERLLNEIIDWALDSAKPKYALALTSLDYTLSEEDQRTIIQVAQASNTHILIVRGNYIAKIALIFTQDLSTAVENVRKNLEEHSELIDDWIKGKSTPEAIGTHNNTVGQSANKVIEEAVKLKTQDIS
ncbi:MAG TPA: hypothetical protein VMW60_00450 [Dehalococcoidales bacterium]|nr:hypothetical protein [Dehalococcoidales bacterium]